MKKQYRNNFQGAVPCFFLPDMCSQTILLVVCLEPCRERSWDKVLLGSIGAAQVCMSYCSFWLNSMSPWLSWHPIHFLSLEDIRTVSSMKGQNLVRVWKSWKIYWLPLQWAIFLLVAFLGGRKNWVCEGFLNLLSPEIWKRICTPLNEIPEQFSRIKSQFCLCDPAWDSGAFGTDSHRRVFLPQNHRD